MNKKMLFVYNQHSGKAQIKNYLCDIIDIFTKGGYDVTAHPTQARSDAYEVIKSIGGEYDFITVSGGDGTLNEAVRGIMSFDESERKPLGYIPSGTVNDFASNLGIPKNMTEAARLITEGREVKCDIGSFNGRTFNYVAAFGAFTDVPYETPQGVKNIFGHTAYVMEGMKKLTDISATHVRLTHDGEVTEGDYLLGLVLNSTHVAGMQLTDSYDVSLCDGLFEIALIDQPEHFGQIGATLTAVMRGETEGRGFRVIRAAKMRFEMDEEVKWTLDGEYGGSVKTAEIEVCPGAMTFISKK